MSLHSEAIDGGFVNLPKCGGRVAWLPDLAGEDARLAWTVLALGTMEGLAKVQPGSAEPRHWSLHRTMLRDYARTSWLTQERLDRIVAGSRMIAQGVKGVDGERMFEAASLTSGDWGVSAGRVRVQPTAAMLDWLSREGRETYSIPLSTWHECGSKWAIGLLVRLYATQSEPKKVLKWDLTLDDVLTLDPTLAGRKLSVIRGVYLKQATDAMGRGAPFHTITADPLAKRGRELVSIRIMGGRLSKPRGALTGLSRPAPAPAPYVTASQTRVLLTGEWRRKDNAERLAGKGRIPGRGMDSLPASALQLDYDIEPTDDRGDD